RAVGKRSSERNRSDRQASVEATAIRLRGRLLQSRPLNRHRTRRRENAAGSGIVNAGNDNHNGSPGPQIGYSRRSGKGRDVDDAKAKPRDVSPGVVDHSPTDRKRTERRVVW